MNISIKQIEKVISLPGAKRYEHFIKTIADREEVWGLYKSGWALAGTEDGGVVFPLWPLREYAEICAVKEWDGYSGKSISLEDLTNFLIPKLKSDNYSVGVFYTPENKGVTPDLDVFLNDLNAELDRY